MKRTAIATAIAAMGGVAGATQAAEWDVRVGGYYNAMVAYSSAEVTDSNRQTSGLAEEFDDDALRAAGNGEVFFRPSLTLDNGLKIGADIQLEAEDDDARMDETYLFVKGSFGEVLIGDQNSAGYKMAYAAPNAAIISLNSPSTDGPYVNWAEANGPGRQNASQLGAVFPEGSSFFFGDDHRFTTVGTTFIENDSTGNSSLGRDLYTRVAYFTPRFAGFQLGMSYAHEGDRDNSAQGGACSGNGGAGLFGRTSCQFLDVGANYVHKFGDFDVGLSARWGIANTNIPGEENPEVVGFGTNLGFGGVTIGGSFAEQNNSVANEGKAYDIGVSYDTGPWTFSYTYFHGENQDDEQFFGGAGPGSDEELDVSTIGADYKLSEGVRLNFFGAYVDFDEQDPDNAASSVRGDDIDGFVIGTGIGLSF